MTNKLDWLDQLYWTSYLLDVDKEDASDGAVMNELWAQNEKELSDS